jgi:eukaryotic-like serine/threonine-protein kinase
MTQGSPELLATLRVLLDQALELAPGERTAWLAELRRAQPDQAREVEGLLAVEAALDDRQFLAGSARAYGPDASAGTDGPRATLAGCRIGAWRLERPLGQGGMGTVWLASRSDGRFEGTAAVKLPNVGSLDARGAERFRREGTALARLNHAHIARLLDAGVTEVGQPYLVLEHVDGERLDRWCDARKLPPEARVRLLLDVLDAVAHAHANLVVHRDLKPSNILVTADGTVKLLDFGIAKLLEDERATDSPTLTDAAGGRALTPEYAAPEQVTGEPITTATDVYALGVLLYMLLAGRHPTGEEGASPATLLRGVVEGEPRRLVGAITGAEARGSTPERLRRLYAGDLDNIVTKALKKRPEERYPTVRAFADDLHRYLTHQPVSARPDSLGYRMNKFVRRHRVPVLLSTLILLTLVGGLVGTITQAVRAGREARVAAEERDFAQHQLARVDAVNDLNYVVLSEAAPGRLFTVGTLMARAESLVERDRGTGPDQVELFVSLGRQYYVQEEAAKARRLFERAYTLSRSLRDRTVRSLAACALGASVVQDGELERGEALVREGLAELPQESRYVPGRIQCLFQGADIARARGDPALAVSRLEAAERLYVGQRYPAPAAALYLQSGLALGYQMAGRLGDAAAAFERAYKLYREMGRDRTASAGTLYNNWALMLGIAGRPLAAESLFRRAMDIERGDSSLPTVSPTLLANYARTLSELDRHDEAFRYAEQADAGARRAGDEYTANVALRLRATIATAGGDLEQAERLLAELATKLRQYPRDHPVFMHLLSARARYLLRRGDLPAAFAAADSAVALADVLAGANQFRPSMLVRRAEVELAMNRFGEAERDARLALDAIHTLVGPDFPSAHAGDAYLVLGQSLVALGRADDARAAFGRAAEQLAATVGTNHGRTLEALRLAARASPPGR